MFFDDDQSASSAALTKQALLDTQERMGVMLDSMPMGLLIHTKQGIIFANRAAASLLRTEQSELVGMHFLDFVGSDREDVTEQIDVAFRGDILPRATELTLSSGTGVRVVNLIAGPLPWQGNSVIQLLLQDITDLKDKEAALRKLTITDELTGAFNRRYAFEIGRAATTDKRYGDLCVIAMDIDHFKKINDTYGHAAGDQALRALSAETQNALAMNGVDCTFARIGGEEFVVILPNSDLAAATVLAEQLRTRFSALSIEADGVTFHFSVSFGVAARADSTEIFDALLSRADAALYAAKHAGRNRVVAAQTPMRQIAGAV
jgi:diguanylate cyclase (GGDEF)-like protein/PAS domain S-box-containing protein